eukprot:2599912-Pyramimonas_sp.AAC.1
MRQDTPGYAAIRQDTPVSRRILAYPGVSRSAAPRDTPGYARIRQDTAGYGRILAYPGVSR